MTTPWYHKTSIYQIYPRSFHDSNNDGIGDLKGILQKLDYLHELGFETLWISPFFSSPQADFGYDISNYTDIAPEYGTMDDAMQLIDQVHKRGYEDRLRHGNEPYIRPTCVVFRITFFAR